MLQIVVLYSVILQNGNISSCTGEMHFSQSVTSVTGDVYSGTEMQIFSILSCCWVVWRLASPISKNLKNLHHSAAFDFKFVIVIISSWLFFYCTPTGERCIVMNASVCVSVRMDISVTRWTSHLHQCSYMSPMVVAQSFSGSNAIHCLSALLLTATSTVSDAPVAWFALFF